MKFYLLSSGDGESTSIPWPSSGVNGDLGGGIPLSSGSGDAGDKLGLITNG